MSQEVFNKASNNKVRKMLTPELEEELDTLRDRLSEEGFIFAILVEQAPDKTVGWGRASNQDNLHFIRHLMNDIALSKE